MNRYLFAGPLALILCLFSPAFAQVRSVQAELQNTIKAKKAKPGDAVKARVVSDVTLANGTTIASDSELLGEVRFADANSIAISFDQVDAHGKKTPLSLTIRAAMMPGSDTSNTARKMNAQADAVIGMPGVTLQAGSGPGHASKFVSESKDFQLKQGLQLILTESKKPAR